MVVLLMFVFVFAFMMLVGFAIDRFKPMASGPYCVAVMLVMATIFASMPATEDFGITVLTFLGMLVAEAAAFGTGIEWNRWLLRRRQRRFEEDFQNNPA